MTSISAPTAMRISFEEACSRSHPFTRSDLIRTKKWFELDGATTDLIGLGEPGQTISRSNTPCLLRVRNGLGLMAACANELYDERLQNSPDDDGLASAPATATLLSNLPSYFGIKAKGLVEVPVLGQYSHATFLCGSSHHLVIGLHLGPAIRVCIGEGDIDSRLTVPGDLITSGGTFTLLHGDLYITSGTGMCSSPSHSDACRPHPRCKPRRSGRTPHRHPTTDDVPRRSVWQAMTPRRSLRQAIARQDLSGQSTCSRKHARG
jgi:hypothetical protein